MIVVKISSEYICRRPGINTSCLCDKIFESLRSLTIVLLRLARETEG